MKLKIFYKKFKNIIKSLFVKPLISKIRLSSILRIVKFKINSNKYFYFKRTKLQYFFHSFNNFRLTERCIEIPIIKYYLNKFPRNNVLEIGNVTKHYYDEFKDFSKKDTVDKYESAYDVINVDIKDFTSDNKYDFIYSVSTFEHMDSDGGRNQDFTPIKSELFSSVAFENINRVINNLLLKNGKFITTFPLGYCNCEIDKSLYKKEYTKFNAKDVNIYFFKKNDEITWNQINITIDQLIKIKPKWSLVKYLCVMEITR
ncbi:hypothetical protein ES705_35765 [subsurface metagenome]